MHTLEVWFKLKYHQTLKKTLLCMICALMLNVNVWHPFTASYILGTKEKNTYVSIGTKSK